MILVSPVKDSTGGYLNEGLCDRHGRCQGGSSNAAPPTSAPTPTPRPTPTATPVPSRAPAGHYAGTTSQSDTISFDVTADSSNMTNLKAAGDVTCTDSSKWTWTVTSSSLSPINATLAFSRAYSGALSSGDSSITNINVSYTLSGMLTPSGAASGTFLLSHMTWDGSGKHYDCTGKSATWTAKLGG
jgi:hypothetical protein